MEKQGQETSQGPSLRPPSSILQAHLHDAEELLLVLNGLTHVVCIHVCEDIGGKEVSVELRERYGKG